MNIFLIVVAVQHERAPRPGVSGPQVGLHKFGYPMSRSHSLFPTHTPLTFSVFPPLHSYNIRTPDTVTHNPFLESFQDFPRLPESISTSEISHLSSLQVGSLGALNPFKISLLSSPLQYPVPHPSYFPPNVFYPPVISSDTAPTEQTCSKYSEIQILLTFKCLCLLLELDFAYKPIFLKFQNLLPYE